MGKEGAWGGVGTGEIWRHLGDNKQGEAGSRGRVMQNRAERWRDTEDRDAVGDRVGTHRGGKIGST